MPMVPMQVIEFNLNLKVTQQEDQVLCEGDRVQVEEMRLAFRETTRSASWT